MASATLERAPGFDAPYADLVGKPFAWKGRGPDAYDCYGVIAELSRRMGRGVPDYDSPTIMPLVHACIEHNVPMWQPCEVGPGAVIVVRCGALHSHVGMVLPYGKMIHAWERSGGVVVEPLDRWSRRITGAYTYREEQ